MGGLVIMEICFKNSDIFSGVILLAPALKPFPATYLYFRKLLNFASFLIPKLQLFSGKNNLSSKNPEVNNFQNIDPFRYRQGARPRTIATLLNGMEHANNVNFFFLNSFNDNFLC